MELDSVCLWTNKEKIRSKSETVGCEYPGKERYGTYGRRGMG